MKNVKLSLLLITLIIFCFSSNIAQQDGSKQIDDKSQKVNNSNETQAVNDKVTFKDGSTTLLEINSEGSAGSIILPSVGSPLSGNKLYNNGGNLFWGNNPLGLAGGGVSAIDDLSDAKTNETSIYLGSNAGFGLTSGINNTAVGINALKTNSSGSSNNAIGIAALSLNTIGGGNEAIGNSALYNNTEGSGNIGVGNSANYYNQTGINNTIIGYRAGFGTAMHNKSGNVFIGYNAGYYEHGSNKLYIENSDIATPLIYGEFDLNKVEINGLFNVKGSELLMQLVSSGENGYLTINNNTGSGSQYLGYFGAFNGTTDLDIGTSGVGNNLNLVTQATPRFIIGNDGRAGLGALEGIASLNVKGLFGDLIALRVADPSSIARFQVSNDGHVGINQWYSNSTFNIRGVSGDNNAFNVENPSGASRFSVTNDGHVGINQMWGNVAMNVRGISGDLTFFTVEDPTGNIIFDIYSNGNAQFYNNLTVSGTLSKGGGSFKIDHPLDPTNKNLYHSFVESPDMMNVYNGNVILDGNGEAIVTMADWFEALNKDFRYQLTPIGAPGPNLYIAEKISGNQFRIAGGSAGMEVSWQVTGVRQDTFANENRIPVEELKVPEERGKYLHPTAFGQPKSAGISYGNRLSREVK